MPWLWGPPTETPEEKAVPSPCRGDGSNVSYDRAKGKKNGQSSLGEGKLFFGNAFPSPDVFYPLIQKRLQDGGFFRVAGGAEAGIGIVRQLFYILGVLAFGKYLLKK